MSGGLPIDVEGKENHVSIQNVFSNQRKLKYTYTQYIMERYKVNTC